MKLVLKMKKIPLAWLWAAWLLPLSSHASLLNSQQIFEKTRPSVVEVVTKSNGDEGVVSRASGFLAFKNDIVVTNYHAITEVVFEGVDHQLEIVTASGKHVQAQVIAVDVRNDLALLKIAESLKAPLLQIRNATPKKGEQGYSMGKPGSYQQLIVGGTFNGTTENASVPKLIFSGAINPGMSGGPTLDANGLVVGINVATSRNNQLLGLAVPVQELQRLVENSNLNVGSNSDLKTIIAKQLAKFGEQQLQLTDKSDLPVRNLGPFEVMADLAPERLCRTLQNNNKELFYKVVELRCSSQDGLYVMQDVYAGHIATGAIWFDGSNLNTWRLAAIVERRLSELRTVGREDENEKPWQCKEERISTHSKVTVHLIACKRPVRDLPGLFDFRFRYTPLIAGTNALIVGIRLSGFDESTAKRVIKKSLANLQVHRGTQP